MAGIPVLMAEGDCIARAWENARPRPRAVPSVSHARRPADDLIRKCIGWTWKVKLSLSLERDLFARLREQSETVAIKVFADNLRWSHARRPASAW